MFCYYQRWCAAAGDLRANSSQKLLFCIPLYCNIFCDRYECNNERDIVINHVTGDAITAAAPAAVGRTPSTAAAAASTDYNAQTDTHTSLELYRDVAA